MEPAQHSARSSGDGVGARPPLPRRLPAPQPGLDPREPGAGGWAPRGSRSRSRSRSRAQTPATWPASPCASDAGARCARAGAPKSTAGGSTPPPRFKCMHLWIRVREVGDGLEDAAGGVLSPACSCDTGGTARPLCKG
jgi:hypothetical protein